MAGELRARIALQRRSDNRNFAIDVDFVVPPGITILFGPSGAGKTTILDVIAGLSRPDSCRIEVGGDVWSDSAAGIDKAPHQRRVAYVFQSLAVFPHMTATQNVAYGINHKLPRGERIERARRLLEHLDVLHLADRKPRTFSGGEAQRVALARALAIQPTVMLLDEPFSALDRDLRVQLAALVRKLVQELGIPALQVTHNHGEARTMGDRILVVKGGRVGFSGPIAEFFDQRTQEEF